MDDLTTNFQHSKSYTNDQRLTFPSFTRNVALSMGSYRDSYTDLYQLTPGQKYYEHTTVLNNSYLYASSYGYNKPAYTRIDVMNGGLYYLAIHNRYKTHNILEWDITNGGFKNQFYDYWYGDVISVGALSILQMQGITGNTHYDNNVSFMPLISSLGINPTYWQNNNMDYNPQSEGLMNIGYNNSGALIETDFYGYPNLAHPTNHFDISPFEAVYADEITYEHIKPIQTIADLSNNNPNNINYAAYLDSLKMFIVREVENESVYLQNYQLGWNHNNWTQESEYKAWYKADKIVYLGKAVTPKTDIGDYNITNQGKLTVYAGEQVVMKPGFHAQAGSHYHAFIHDDNCAPPSFSIQQSMQATNNDIQNEFSNTVPNVDDAKTLAEGEKDVLEIEQVKVYPNPNQGMFTIVLPTGISNGVAKVTDLSGRHLDIITLHNNNTTVEMNWPSGIYMITIMCNEKQFYKKIIIQ